MVVLGQEKQTHWLIINEQNDFEKIHLYARDLSEPRYEYLIKKYKDAGIKYLDNPNAFIKCLNMMDNVYENINDYNLIRKRKILIVWWHDWRYYGQ